MKRSKGLSLVLMGSLSLAGTAYGAENAGEGVYTFSSVEECVAGKIFSEAECNRFSKQAASRTPRFRSQEECEAKFGADACTQRTSPALTNQDGTVVQRRTGGFWMPMMTGFMAGRYLGNDGAMTQSAQALYRDPAADARQGVSYRTASGDTVKPGPGGKVENPSPRVVQSLQRSTRLSLSRATSRIDQSLQHSARPTLSRSGSGAYGGFAGGARASS